MITFDEQTHGKKVLITFWVHLSFSSHHILWKGASRLYYALLILNFLLVIHLLDAASFWVCTRRDKVSPFLHHVWLYRPLKNPFSTISFPSRRVLAFSIIYLEAIPCIWLSLIVLAVFLFSYFASYSRWRAMKVFKMQIHSKCNW